MTSVHAERGIRGWLYFMAMCLAWTFDARAAQMDVQPAKLELRISAQPLDDALQEFARQSGLQVIYFSNLTVGIECQGLNGKYTVAEALTALLAGTGLNYHMLNARTVVIRKTGAAERRR